MKCRYVFMKKSGQSSRSNAAQYLKGIFILFWVVNLNPVWAAYQLQITNRQFPNGGNAALLNPMADAIETQFNSALTASNNEAFLTSVGNANAGATRSYFSPGVYADGKISGSFSMSGAFSGGTKTGGTSNSLPEVGVAAHSGITLGASGEIFKVFGGLDPKRVMVHASFYMMDLSRYFGGNITLDSLQVSTGVTYQLYAPRPWLPMMRFNGIRLSSSIAYGSFNGSYITPFTNSSGGATMTSDVRLNVDSNVFTFSNEATTGVRLFYLLDVFTGLGVDFNAGSTSLSAEMMGGSVTATSGGSTVFTGDASLTGTPESASPSIVQLRWLLGTQVNLGPMGVFAQVQVSTPSVYSLIFGGKLTF